MGSPPEPVPAALRLLYSGGLRGEIDLLPRLFTAFKPWRASAGRVLLLDLGESCATAVWHCAATGGRSLLMVFDAMGYDAVNTAGLLSDEARARLPETLRVAPVDTGQPWGDASVVALLDDPPPDDGRLVIALRPAASTALAGAVLTLAAVEAGRFGVVDLAADAGRWRVVAADVYPLLPAALPDPTIAAAVEFVLAEARYYARRNSPGEG